MSDFEKELAKAYEEATNAELDAVIAEAKKNPPVFSDRFEKSMEEMIKTGKPDKLWGEDYSDSGAKKKKLSKRGLKVLLIAAAVLLALTAVACAVPEIRESIAGFFVRIFSDHVEYYDPTVTKDRIEELYGLVPIPEGFSVIKTLKTDYDVITTYINDNNSIVLQQSANKNVSSLIDSEGSVFSDCIVGGKHVRLCVSNNFAQASWSENGYYFIINYTSSINEDLFKSWIENVHIIEKNPNQP